MERVVHKIQPVYDADSRILVLGTMPSPASRSVGFFYGHPQNRFWRVMERLFDLPDHALVENDVRTDFLLAHHIALWDVLASCSIEGASDASIADPVPNDLTRILDASPIERAFATGGTAAKLCRRFDGKLLRKRGIPLTPLPSTSGANARMRLDDLVIAWCPLAAALDPQKAKRALRHTMISRRDAMAEAERDERAARICSQLTELLEELPQHSTVAAFAAMRSEVDLDPFIHAAYRCGHSLAFPCMQHGRNGHQVMVMRAVDENDYRTGRVPFMEHPVASFEPTPEQDLRHPIVDPERLDMVVVPLVAFDDTGARLGYGGGNYDAYLPRLRPGCRVAGVAFTPQRVPAVPVEPHDRPLGCILHA